MNELALFAGAGGGILAGNLLGWTTVCAVECDAYAAQILASRQNDGCLEPFPIWSDVKSFNGKLWNGIVDVISGGFPCQDISAAGGGAGIDGEKSGLWKHMARIISEVQPRFVFVENSSLLVKRGLAVVISDLAEMGYDAQWCIVSASDVDAPHKRDRLWIVANNNRTRELQSKGLEQDKRGRTCDCGEAMENPKCERCKQVEQAKPGREDGKGPANKAEHASITGRLPSWPVEPGMGRVADGVVHRMDRLKALGNGQVPRVASTAFQLLSKQPC